jgi:hypothetical protein
MPIVPIAMGGMASAQTTGRVSVFGHTMKFTPASKNLATRVNIPLLIGSSLIFLSEHGSIYGMNKLDGIRETSIDKKVEAAQKSALDRLNFNMKYYNDNCKKNK